MNDSNQSLRFSRSYLEATGKPLHSRDFYVPEPMVTKKEAVFWFFAVIVLNPVLVLTVYVLKGF